jgi:hypothetical protein
MSMSCSIFSDCRPAVLIFSMLLFAGCSSAPQEADSGKMASTSPTVAGSASTPPGSTVAVAHGSGSPSTSATQPGSAPVSAAQSANSQASSAGGIKWTTPVKWKAGPERQMRAATYFIPAAAGDSEDGECAVFFGIGGGVEANLKRWVGQFEQPDGKPSESLVKQKRETINGLQVTTIDLTGTYGGGGPMMGQSAKKTGYRLLGAIVEGPQGEIFFKLTGPAKTVAAAQADFQALLKSLGRS